MTDLDPENVQKDCPLGHGLDVLGHHVAYVRVQVGPG